MHNFEFHNPVKVLFGKNQIENIKHLIPQNKNILLTYGMNSIKANGIYQRVINNLPQVNNLVEFGGIGANPEYNILLEAVNLCKHEKVDFILAIGGGSVIDGTKFISASVNFPILDKWQILKGQSSKICNSINYGVIQTLPATGSEMNEYAVISRKETYEKLAFGHNELFPKFAILEPEITYSLPNHQLINGIIDPFIHVTEQYLTTNINTLLQDGYSETIMRTLINLAPKLFSKKHDYDVRANWMWCANNALNNYIGVGVDEDWATHAIGHELTALYSLDHAQTLAIIAPQLWRYKKEQKRQKLIQFAKNIWNINDKNCNIAIEKAIFCTEQFFNNIGMKTKLSDYNIQADAAAIANNVIKNSKTGSIGEHNDIRFNDIVNIIKMSN
ncbi:MAG: NADH-dependent alcohol dehydrogenase [Burkholderiales bacterium]|jgi:NADP-dependent alcohol dehydrogenase|nr:NADH-dependent alcohol dehydrogenase [Burkholderiales bacterium]